MGRGRRDHGQFTVFHIMRERQVVSDNTLPKENLADDLSLDHLRYCLIRKNSVPKSVLEGRCRSPTNDMIHFTFRIAFPSTNRQSWSRARRARRRHRKELQSDRKYGIRPRGPEDSSNVWLVVGTRGPVAAGRRHCCPHARWRNWRIHIRPEFELP